ncbi:hypothetical protein BH11PSE8_BH11PSE8_36430 [soil metagenome]
MTHLHMKKGLLGAMLASAALLSACGGGDDNTPAPTTSVPGSASESVGGFIDYLKRLVTSTADMLEPVDVSAVTPQTSETAEPETVD